MSETTEALSGASAMGGICSRPKINAAAPAPVEATEATEAPVWDQAALTKVLKALETSLNEASMSKLAPKKPWPPTPDPAFADAVKEWGFDIWAIPYAELPALAYHSLVMHPAISDPSSEIDLAKMWRYTCEIATRYHMRPFHNFRHAVDVLLGVSCLVRLIQRDHAGDLDNPMMLSALLISAMVHDADHPGVMNGYLKGADHAIAQRLGDDKTAILEHHHAAIALALLERPELDFLHKFSAEKRAEFMRLVKDNVLNTDVTTTMTRAKEFNKGGRRVSESVEQFKEARMSGAPPPSTTEVCRRDTRPACSSLGIWTLFD